MNKTDVVRVRDAMINNQYVMIGKKDGKWVVDASTIPFRNVLGMDWWEQIKCSIVMTLAKIKKEITEIERRSLLRKDLMS